MSVLVNLAKFFQAVFKAIPKDGVKDLSKGGTANGQFAATRPLDKSLQIKVELLRKALRLILFAKCNLKLHAFWNAFSMKISVNVA